MARGFIRLRRDFLLDGQTLVVTGVRGDDGILLASQARVVPPDAAPAKLVSLYAERFGAIRVEGVEVPAELEPVARHELPFPVLGPHNG